MSPSRITFTAYTQRQSSQCFNLLPSVTFVTVIFGIRFEICTCLQEAIDWMNSHPDVFHNGLGVVGVSKGGDIALLMATHSPKVEEIIIIMSYALCLSYDTQ